MSRCLRRSMAFLVCSEVLTWAVYNREEKKFEFWQEEVWLFSVMGVLPIWKSININFYYPRALSLSCSSINDLIISVYFYLDVLTKMISLRYI